MFISDIDAAIRLRSERNLFRDPAVAPVEVDEPIDESGCGEAAENQELEDDEVEAKGVVEGSLVSSSLSHKSTKSTKANGKSSTTDPDSHPFEHLDQLLHPKIKGRANYRNKLESQVAIAETSLIVGQAMTSRVFDLSLPQTEAYKNGRHSTSDITNKVPYKAELKSRIDVIKGELALKAAARLDCTLDALSASKISEIEHATDMARVAKDMAVILEKVSDKDRGIEGGVHFHIMRPEQASINQYPTVILGPAPDSSLTNPSLTPE